MEVDEHPETGLKVSVMDQRRAANAAFGKYVENEYRNWLTKRTDRPKLSHEVIETYALPKMTAGKSLILVVIDCLRLDQWLIMEDFLHDYFTISKDYYYSILPTATPYSRNAIFSGSCR